jgi:phage terminase small subunit
MSGSRLTAKQEAFIQAVVSGMNNSEAYRSVYYAEGMKPETINRNAHSLANDSKIATRIAEIREGVKEELVEKLLWTREDSVKALCSVIEKPDKKSDIVAAVKELNSMHGFNEPIKIHQTGDNGPRVIEILGFGEVVVE